jgi:hypothetical protein
MSGPGVLETDPGLLLVARIQDHINIICLKRSI